MGEYYYLDKSLFIQEIWEESRSVLLFPRPRRFGKTTNLSILRYFFDNRKRKEANPVRDLIPENPGLIEKEVEPLLRGETISCRIWDDLASEI